MGILRRFKYICLFPVCGSSQTSNLNFCFGLSFGLVIAFLIASFTTIRTPLVLTQYSSNYIRSPTGGAVTKSPSRNTSLDYDNLLHDELDKKIGKVREIQFNDAHMHHGKYSFVITHKNYNFNFSIILEIYLIFILKYFPMFLSLSISFLHVACLNRRCLPFRNTRHYFPCETSAFNILCQFFTLCDCDMD